MNETDYKNIDKIKTILKIKSIKDFFKSNFKDFTIIGEIYKGHINLYTPNDCSYIIYKSNNGEVKIT